MINIGRLRFWLLALLWFPLFTEKVRSSETVELMPLIQEWRYEQSGGDLGTAWRAVDYDDSGWPRGRAVLGWELENATVQTLTNTVLSRRGTNGVEMLTYYFRTHFNAPALPAGWCLVASNLVDDGAVFYLNGVELFRWNMPSGEVTSLTLASEWIDTWREGIFTITNLSIALLREGDNVLAVEVHQPYVTSSDVAFGMVLMAMPQEQLRFSLAPKSITVKEGSSARLYAEAAGGLPRYQWWRDGTPLPGETNAELRFLRVRESDAGLYSVVATNDVSSVTSQVVALTVVLDTEPPRLLDAEVTTPGHIRVSFSEVLDDQTAVTAGNYRVRNTAGENIAVTSASRYAQSTVDLTSAPLRPGMTHWVVVNGVEDEFGNAIEPESGVAIRTTTTNVLFGSPWRYNDTGVYPGNNWRGTNYDDQAWSLGAGMFVNDPNLDDIDPPGLPRTFLAVTNAEGSFWTHYFRTWFTNTAAPVGAEGRLGLFVDDGAVFYLNSAAALHANMPSGSVTHTTRANSSAQEGILQNWGFVVTNLTFGANLLAAEVHQFSLASPTFPDVSFDTQLEIIASSYVDGPPLILSQPADVETWEGRGAVFVAQVARAESVQWWQDGIPIPGATSVVYSNAAAGWDANATFTLVASNVYGLTASRAAKLSVRLDRLPPRLLAAAMGIVSNRVTLTFSEPVAVGSASDVHAYNIVDGAGQPLRVLGASMTSSSNVVLETEPRVIGQRYTLTAFGVKDLSSEPRTALNGQLEIDYERPFLTYTSVWKYNDGGTNIGVTWRLAEFDDSHWPSGPGLLGFEDFDVILPVPLNTILPPPEFRGPTYYFRTWFNNDSAHTNTVLRLRHIIDDGAVFYLNGEEIHLFNMPLTHAHGTLATQAVDTARIQGSFVISTGWLLPGANVIAAEIHQITVTSADSVFGAELVEAWPGSAGSGPGPVLHWSREGGRLQLWWNDWQTVLETAPSIEGPWAPAGTPSIPYALPTGGGTAFYRLRSLGP